MGNALTCKSNGRNKVAPVERPRDVDKCHDEEYPIRPDDNPDFFDKYSDAELGHNYSDADSRECIERPATSLPATAYTNEIIVETYQRNANKSHERSDKVSSVRPDESFEDFLICKDKELDHYNKSKHLKVNVRNRRRRPATALSASRFSDVSIMAPYHERQRNANKSHESSDKVSSVRSDESFEDFLICKDKELDHYNKSKGRPATALSASTSLSGSYTPVESVSDDGRYQSKGKDKRDLPQRDEKTDEVYSRRPDKNLEDLSKYSTGGTVQNVPKKPRSGKSASKRGKSAIRLGKQKLTLKISRRQSPKTLAKSKKTKKRKGKGAWKLKEQLQKASNHLAESNIAIASVYGVIAQEKENGVALLCLTTKYCDLLPSTYHGFSVIQKPFNPKSSKSFFSEAIGARYRYDKVKCKQIDETIAFHSESLMQKHTNLEVIKMSLEIITEDGRIPEPCIVFLCRCKSYIPFGESEFPKRLRHPKSDICFPTDVREGYLKLGSFIREPNDFYQEIAMGCSIGPANDIHGYSASLGPFVNIKETNELCFLTVRHLFQPLHIPDTQIAGTIVVQPADSENRTNLQVSNRYCGTVKVAKFNNLIDAVLVTIDPARRPSRGHFIGLQTGDLESTGFGESSYPTYDDGCSKDARQFNNDNVYERIIKIGKKSGLTRGSLGIKNMAARITDATGQIRFGSRIQSHAMSKQLQVDSYARKKFFIEGDSGSAVFLADRDNNLFCIGMAIGVTSDDFTCMVTPIQTILLDLGRELRKTLELKTFRLEEMDL